MITQYRFLLAAEDGRPLPSSTAYRLYGWLLGQLPQQLGDAWHQPGQSPLTQHLCRDASGRALWTLNLLEEQSAGLLAPVLEGLSGIPLHTGALAAQPLDAPGRYTAQELLLQAQRLPDTRRRELCFLTPTAFRQEGRYTIWPQERLVLQSLTLRWNELFPEFSLRDEDALEALRRGLFITDYRLATTRYPLKNVRIPGFYGSVWVESRLPAPLEEVWRLLLCFLPCAGVGVKTTLGMGGCRLGEIQK